MRNLTIDDHNQGIFPQNQGNFFQFSEIPRPCLFQSGYSQLNHHKRDSQIPRTKNSYSLYSLIEPQPHSCAPYISCTVFIEVLLLYFVRYIHGYMKSQPITTAQLHSTKPELRFYVGSNLARGVSEICHCEDF